MWFHGRSPSWPPTAQNCMPGSLLEVILHNSEILPIRVADRLSDLLKD